MLETQLELLAKGLANCVSPDWATVLMSTPCSSAMKPNTEKMAKPARKLVLLFRRHRRKESLEG